jgi:PAS domain S-box-containing protein
METSRDELIDELRDLETQNRELRAGQRALEEARRRYVDLYDLAPVGYFTFTRQGRVQEVNLAGAQLLGRDRQRLYDRPFAAAARLADPGRFLLHLERCFAGDRRVTAELTLRVGGRAIDVQIDSVPLYGAQGPYAVRSVLTDITARKEAERSLARASHIERELRQRLELLSRVHTAITEDIAAAPLEAVLRSTADRARELVDAELGALCLDGATLPFPREGLQSLLTVPIHFRDKNVGELHLANKRGGQFSDEDRSLIEGLASRVGPAIEIARLREQEARERGRVEFVAEAGALLSESLDWDVVLARIAQLALPRLADCCVVVAVEDGGLKRLAAAHVDEAREPLVGAVQPFVERALASGAVQCAYRYDDSEIDGAHPDADERARIRALEPRSILAIPFSLHGRVAGVIELIYCAPSGRHYDQTDVLLASAVCQRAALALDNARLYRDLKTALTAREDMLAVVAHDLRNPLAAIRLQAELLERRISDGDLRKLVGRQKQAVYSTLRLVDDLLDAAALDAGAVSLDFGEHPVVGLVDSATAMFAAQAAEKRIRIESDVPHPFSVVRCDAQRIVQALGNLIANAVKFAPQGGEVRVAARRGSGGAVELVVSDDGPGISNEMRPHLFERFWKGQKLGTGLGLYIARRIVGAHGGSIEVDSAPGRGSTFTISLP